MLFLNFKNPMEGKSIVEETGYNQDLVHNKYVKKKDKEPSVSGQQDIQQV